MSKISHIYNKKVRVKFNCVNNKAIFPMGTMNGTLRSSIKLNLLKHGRINLNLTVHSLMLL